MSKNAKCSILCAAIVLIAALGTRAQAVKTGDVAPDFTLAAASGKPITLSEAVKDAPVVLVFYRGYWCPFCVGQLAELRGLLAANEKTTLYAISVDPADKTKQLVGKIEKDGKGKVLYTFLSDPGAKTIDAYNLRDPRYAGEKFDGIPYPAVYVIGAGRKVIWAKIEKDYKNRPTNAEIRAAIERAKLD